MTGLAPDGLFHIGSLFFHRVTRSAARIASDDGPVKIFAWAATAVDCEIVKELRLHLKLVLARCTTATTAGIRTSPDSAKTFRMIMNRLKYRNSPNRERRVKLALEKGQCEYNVRVYCIAARSCSLTELCCWPNHLDWPVLPMLSTCPHRRSTEPVPHNLTKQRQQINANDDRYETV